MGLYWGYVKIILGLYWGYIQVILGYIKVILRLYWGCIGDCGKENGNYYSILGHCEGVVAYIVPEHSSSVMANRRNRNWKMKWKTALYNGL